MATPKPHGILKKPASSGPLDNDTLEPDSESGSFENDLPQPITASSSKTYLDMSPPYSSTMPTKGAEELQEIPLHDSDNDTDFTHQKEVRFPDELPPAPSPSRPAYVRQDSDVGSTRSSIGTDDDDSETYDWSDEADLVDEQAKFDKKFGRGGQKKGWGITRVLSFLVSSLIGSTFLAGVLITPAVLIHFYWYKRKPTDHRRYVKDNVQAWLFWVAANLVISWALAMIIDIVPIFFRYFISLTWGHVSERVKTRIEMYDSVKNTAKPVFYAASAWASWAIIFTNIYELHDSEDDSLSRAQYTNRLAQVIAFFFFLILVWRVQAMISHFIAFSFHRVAYAERISEVEKALVVIEKLRDYRPKLTPRDTPRGARTPVFGSWSYGAGLTDYQHRKALSGALKQVSRNTPLRIRDDKDYDADGDLSDAERAMAMGRDQEKVKHGKRRPKSRTSQDLNRLSWTGSIDLNDAPGARTPPRSSGLPEEIEMMPPLTHVVSPGQTYNSAPVEPSHLNPGRYTPLTPADERPDMDFDDTETRKPEVIKTAARVFKNAVLHDARNIRGANDSESAALAWNVNSAHEAKRLARSIYTRLKDRGRTWLIPSDFYPAFTTKDEAEEAFKVFDKDGNGDLSRAELKTTLLKIYKERRFLSRSMRDVGEALRTLDQALLVFAAIILFFISISVFGVDVGDSLTSAYTIGIAASFVFKESASNAFDSIMLLFVTHPFDTGDRVLIGTQNLVVTKVGLFATVFTRADGTMTYFFNSQLFNVFILNMRRSGKTFENMTLQVAWDTPLTKLDALEKCLNDWLSTEENRWYEPSTAVTFQHIRSQRYLELTVGIGHNGNWQDWGLRNARKTAFHAAAQYYCRKLGIIGYEAPMPIVYANPETKAYHPPNDSTLDVTPDDDDDAEPELQPVRPTLGFLPAPSDRSARLTRARKSRSRKANVGASNGE